METYLRILIGKPEEGSPKNAFISVYLMSTPSGEYPIPHVSLLNARHCPPFEGISRKFIALFLQNNFIASDENKGSQERKESPKAL